VFILRGLEVAVFYYLVTPGCSPHFSCRRWSGGG